MTYNNKTKKNNKNIIKWNNYDLHMPKGVFDIYFFKFCNLGN